MLLQDLKWLPNGVAAGVRLHLQEDLKLHALMACQQCRPWLVAVLATLQPHADILPVWDHWLFELGAYQAATHHLWSDLVVG